MKYTIRNAALALALIICMPVSADILDASFNPAGMPPGTVVTTTGGNTYPKAIGVQSDGTVIVAGATPGFGLEAYSSTGTFIEAKSTFATGSAFGVPLGGFVTDSLIASTGWASIGGVFRFVLMRYDGVTRNFLGETVTTFANSSGSLNTSATSYLDGSIILAGFIRGPLPTARDRFGVARYLSNGTIDDSGPMGFNTAGAGGDLPGTVTKEFAGSDKDNGNAVAVNMFDPSNLKITVGGYARVAGRIRFALARWEEDGDIDTGFGGNGGDDPGTVTTELVGSTDDRISGLTIQIDGNIIAVGSATVGGAEEMAVARYGDDGILDPTFNPAGTPPGTLIISNTTLGAALGATVTAASASSVSIQPDGKILIGGRATVGGATRYIIVRLLPNGILDTTFDGSGATSTVFSAGASKANAVFSIDDSSFFAAGETDSKISIAKYATNSSPVANNTSASTPSGTPPNPKTITLTHSDADGDPVTYSIVPGSGPFNGSLGAITPAVPTTGDAMVTYTPTAGYVGGDSFMFRVNDGSVDSNNATVFLDVQNTGPVADATTASTNKDQAVTIPLSGSDINNQPLTFSVMMPPTNGNLDTLTPAPLTPTTSQVTYTPNPGYVGADSFTFKVYDGTTDSTPATVSINVINNGPVAIPGSASTLKGSPKVITLSGFDVDGDPLTYSIVSPPTKGTLSAVTPATPTTGTATVTYKPNAGFAGADSFTFKVNDGAVDSAPATISVNVSGGPFVDLLVQKYKSRL